MHISILDPVFNFWGIYPEVQILNHVMILFLMFLRKLHTVFHYSYTISHPHQHWKMVPISLYLSNTYFFCVCFFDNNHPNASKVISFQLWLLFSWWLRILNIFSCVYWPSKKLWRYIYYILYTFFESVVCLFIVES